MKNRILMLIVYLCLLSVLPGCWDYTEYEALAELVGMGFDYDPATQETTITIQYPSIKRGGGGTGGGAASDPQWIVHAATDKTFFGALTKLQEIIPQRLFYGYVKVLIVGEAAAKQNIMDLIDLFDRTPVMRSAAFVVITAGKAEDVLKTADPARIASAEAIHRLITQSKKSGTAHAVTLHDFTQMLAIGGWEATAPHVISTEAKKPPAKGKDAKGGSQEKDTEGGSQEKQGEDETQDEEDKGGTQENIRFHAEQTGALRITGMAAFHGDKFAGWLNDQETLGFNWITGHKISAYKASLPEGGADVEKLYFRVLKADRKIKVYMENGQPVITLYVKVVADIRKYYRKEGSDFLFAPEIRDAENRLAESIRADINAALIKGQQELKSDIFGFGFAVFRDDPKLWQQEYEAKWADIYPDIPVNVYIDAKVVNTGITVRKLFIK